MGTSAASSGGGDLCNRPLVGLRERLMWKFGFLSAIALVGLITTVLLWQHTKQLERGLGMNTFDALTGDHEFSMSGAVDRMMDGLHLFSDVIRTFPDLSASDYNTLAHSVINVSPGVPGVGVLEFVPHEGREEFEADVRENFNISDGRIRNPNGSIAEERPWYVAPRFLFPLADVFRTDIYVIPSRRRLVDAIVELPNEIGPDRPPFLSTPPIFLLDGPKGYLVGTHVTGFANRRRVLLMSILFAQFMRAALPPSQGHVISCVWDVSNATRREFMFHSDDTKDELDPSICYAQADRTSRAFHKAIFGRDLEVEVSARKDFEDQIFRTTPTILIAGILLTVTVLAVSLWYFHVREKHRQRQIQEIQNAASLRTHQELVSYLCHEIRNPLHVMRAIVRDPAGMRKPRMQELLQDSVDQIRFLVDDVLSVRRLAEHRLNMKPRWVDVLGIVRDVVQKYRLSVSPGVELRVVSEQALPRHVFLDGLRLRQLVENGLTNAIRHTVRGAITIRVSSFETDVDWWEDDVAKATVPTDTRSPSARGDMSPSLLDEMSPLPVGGATNDEDADNAQGSPSPGGNGGGGVGGFFAPSTSSRKVRALLLEIANTGVGLQAPGESYFRETAAGALTTASRRLSATVGPAIAGHLPYRPPPDWLVEKLDEMATSGLGVGTPQPTGFRTMVARFATETAVERGDSATSPSSPGESRQGAAMLSHSLASRHSSNEGNSTVQRHAGEEQGRSGLGLPIGASIARMLGGYIGLEDVVESSRRDDDLGLFSGDVESGRLRSPASSPSPRRANATGMLRSGSRSVSRRYVSSSSQRRAAAETDDQDVVTRYWVCLPVQFRSSRSKSSDGLALGHEGMAARLQQQLQQQEKMGASPMPRRDRPSFSRDACDKPVPSHLQPPSVSAVSQPWQSHKARWTSSSRTLEPPPSVSERSASQCFSEANAPVPPTVASSVPTALSPPGTGAVAATMPAEGSATASHHVGGSSSGSGSGTRSLLQTKSSPQQDKQADRAQRSVSVADPARCLVGFRSGSASSEYPLTGSSSGPSRPVSYPSHPHTPLESDGGVADGSFDARASGVSLHSIRRGRSVGASSLPPSQAEIAHTFGEGRGDDCTDVPDEEDERGERVETGDTREWTASRAVHTHDSLGGLALQETADGHTTASNTVFDAVDEGDRKEEDAAAAGVDGVCGLQPSYTAPSRRRRRRRRQKRRARTFDGAADDRSDVPASGDSAGDWNQRGPVIVVDDDRSVLVITSHHLESMGLHYVALDDGLEVEGTLQSLRGEGEGEGDGTHPFAILLDIVMVHSRGTHVCQNLRRAGETMPIVAMTANITKDEIVEYKRCGFNAVLGKPFDADDVKRLLHWADSLQATGEWNVDAWNDGNTKPGR